MSLKKIDLADGERLDDLQINGLKIIQHEAQFRFSVDAVLLAHIAHFKRKSRMIDLGTGSGIIPLLLTTRGGENIIGLEINPIMAGLAQRSIEYNGLTDKIKIMQGDLREVKQVFSAGMADLVVSNPPYRPLTHGKVSLLDDVAKARHEVSATLRDVIGAARYLLNMRGRFAMVHLPERLAEIIVEMNAWQIEPKRLQFVHSKQSQKPVLVLIEGIVGAGHGLTVDKPFVIYHEDGTYHEDMLAYYKRGC